jgi:hypothetical protein
MSDYIHFISESITLFAEYYIMPKLEYMAINVVFYISSFSHTVYNNIQPYYEKIPYIQSLIENVHKYLINQYKYLINCYVEPDSSNWISISYSDISKRKYFEKNIVVLTITDFSDFNDYYNSQSFMKTFEKDNIEVLKIMLLSDHFKYSRRYIGDSINELTKNNTSTTMNVPSKIRFLSIEYYHPKMSNSISITLDKRYLYADNEIFSYTFIHRELKHQTRNYVFDSNYILKIMDSNIKMIHLTYGKYLRLNPYGYEIKINSIK